ncbi:hypothetical protein [Candidatus Clostridium radicumherbarum]|uniref:Uncharacterized protein n=1 Tax=Candidatus Clostridium radicumherbarum TaxID=3381662 RepID=A0ABW8TWN0_9CLOT
MLGYNEVDKVNAEISPYLKPAEGCKISGAIEVNAKLYKEVIFYKNSFFKFNKEVKGYLYFDDENNLVTDKTIISELAKLCFFYEMFFSEDKTEGILATLKTKADLTRDNEKVKQISDGLDFLLTQKVYAAERVKSIFIKNYNLDEKSNSILEELSSNIKTLSDQDSIFNVELFNKLYPYYEEVLKINFEKVLNVASIGDCIEEVRKEAEKIRKKWGVRAMKNMVGKLIKISDELSYFKRLISIYRSVLQMNSSQYLKYLNNTNKDKIEKRISLIRG